MQTSAEVDERIVVRDGQPYLMVTPAMMKGLVRRVVSELVASGYRPDGAIIITKGGIWFAYVAEYLQIGYALWAAQRYRPKGDGSIAQVADKRVVFSPNFTVKGRTQGDDWFRRLQAGEPVKLILADDLTDGGPTFDVGEQALRSWFGNNFELRRICLWKKSCSTARVDIVGEVLEKHGPTGQWPWIYKLEEQFFDDCLNGLPRLDSPEEV